jgi:hypothetical protein
MQVDGGSQKFDNLLLKSMQHIELGVYGYQKHQ